jgi:hypothetical protein
MLLNQPADQPKQVTMTNQNGEVCALKTVDDFKYLGATVASTESDFKKRIAIAWQAFWELEKLWRSRSVPITLKVSIFKAAVITILLYGCESWILGEQLTSRLNSFATNCYRIMLNIKRIDKITNVDLYSKVGEKELSQKVFERQLTWVGHALRRPDTEPCRIFALY